jgi:hypothetical protein
VEHAPRAFEEWLHQRPLLKHVGMVVVTTNHAVAAIFHVHERRVDMMDTRKYMDCGVGSAGPDVFS